MSFIKEGRSSDIKGVVEVISLREDCDIVFVVLSYLNNLSYGWDPKLPSLREFDRIFEFWFWIVNEEEGWKEEGGRVEEDVEDEEEGWIWKI